MYVDLLLKYEQYKQMLVLQDKLVIINVNSFQTKERDIKMSNLQVSLYYANC